MNPFDQNSNFFQFYNPSMFPQSLQHGPTSIHIFSLMPVQIFVGTPSFLNQPGGGFPHFTGSPFQHFNGSAFQPPTNVDPSATINPGMFWQDPRIFNGNEATTNNNQEPGLIPNPNPVVSGNPEVVTAAQYVSTEVPTADQGTSNNPEHSTRSVIQASSHEGGQSSKASPNCGDVPQLPAVYQTNEVATCSNARTDPVRIERNKTRLLCEQVGQTGGEKLKPIRPCPLRYKPQEDSMSEGEAQNLSSKTNPCAKGNVAVVIEENVLQKACDAVAKATRSSDRLTEKRLKGESGQGEKSLETFTAHKSLTGLALMHPSSAHTHQQTSGKQNKRRKIQ